MQLFRSLCVHPEWASFDIYIAAKIWKIIDVIFVLLHDADGRMLFRPDIHGLGLLAVDPKSDPRSNLTIF